MRATVRRIGLYRVAAILIGFALVLEIVRVQAVSGTTATVACTFGEVAFLALAALAFVHAGRAHRRG